MFKILNNVYEQCLKMAKCNSIEHNFHETPNMYLNLSANTSNDQPFRLNKINEIKDFLLQRLEKEN